MARSKALFPLLFLVAAGVWSRPAGDEPEYPGAGSGRHYWIDGGAGDDANPGSRENPWKTVDKLESLTLEPGDLVHVLPGPYEIQGSLMLRGIAGKADGWIGIVAEGAVTLRNSARANVVTVEDCRYLFLKGFEITHDNRGRPYGAWDRVDGVKFQKGRSEHVSIDSCRLHGLGNVAVSSQAPWVEHLTVYGCEIYDSYTGIYWGYYEHPQKRYAHFGRIARNYIRDCPPEDLNGTGYGIQIKGGSRGNVIEDNVLVNVAGASRAAIAVYHASTEETVASEPNLIRRNFIRGSRSEGIYASEGAVIENNIVLESRTRGISVSTRDSGGWGSFYGNLTIRNNTVFRVSTPGGRALSLQGFRHRPPLVVANNLLLVEGADQLALAGPLGFAGEAYSNFCYGATGGSGLGVVRLSSLAVVESLIYGSARFLRPVPDSILTDAARPERPADDFDGRARGEKLTAGAYEISVGGNTGWTLSEGFKR
jgi:hypothetical protein